MNTYNGKTWSGWSQVPGGGLTDVGLAAVNYKGDGGGVTDAPVAAVTSGGKISIFARGVADGRVYVNTYR